MNARRRKYIYSLKRQDGSLTWDQNEKAEIVRDYFSGVLGTKEQRSSTLNWERLGLSGIQEQPGLELDRPFTEEEVAAAVKCLPSGRAPGPDGFTNNFYKACWDIIKFDIMAAFHNIYVLRCEQLAQVNGAQIVLIPKVEVTQEVKDFRPISLIHSFAKLFTKVLALRLSSYIDQLVSGSQSAFIKGRCIQDNYIYVRGLARHYHRTKTPACLLKLDISKAFDTVSWEYLLELLSRRGFSLRWTLQ